MIALIISGLPASGKGTQCKMIASAYGLVHLDTGENLRREMDKGTVLGREAKKFISHGQLVPDLLIKELVKKMLGKHSLNQGFVFDGFPRTLAQALILEEFSIELQLAVKGMIYLDVDQNQIIKRIQIRASQKGRKDDQDPDIISKRIDAQKTQLKDLINFYQKQNKFFPAQGNGSMDQVFENIKNIISRNDLLEQKV